MNTFLKLPNYYYCSNCYWWEAKPYSTGLCLYYNNSRDWNTDATKCVHWVTIDNFYFRGD